ncbi:MAG TPA: hypothetical protein VEH27_19045 [Methylomirabilota bacterium]|nr:hypothetical protein [Methylomirabilota bacterium]
MPKKVNQKYQNLRAKLLKRGTNLSRWAASHGYPITTVYGAARGERAGIKATEIRLKLETLANG